MAIISGGEIQAQPVAQPAPAAPAPTVVVSVSLTGVNQGSVVRKAKLGLRVDITPSSSADSATSPAGNASRVLPLASLLHSDGTSKEIEIVLWLDPRHFSLDSDRHGFVIPDSESNYAGQHVVLAKPLNNEVAKALRATVRKASPVNETSAVGVLLLADEDVLADFTLPLYVRDRNSPGVPSAAPVFSFRPAATDDQSSGDAVLTLVELRPRHVQLIFADSSGLRSWRVANNRTLKDWPKYVDDGITGAELATAASNFNGALFPSGDRCEAGDCAAAAAMFDSWAQRTLLRATPPVLTVQALPKDDDENYTPLLMPTGMLPIARESGDLPLEEVPEQHSALDEPSMETVPIPASDAENDVSSTDALPPEAAPVGDPADPQFDTNHPAETLDDPAAQSDAQQPSGAGAAIGVDEHASNYLAYRVVSHVPLYRDARAAANAPCASAWSVFLPPNVPDPDGGLDAARLQMKVLLGIWDGMAPQASFDYWRTLEPLKRAVQPEQSTASWLIVSHYSMTAGALRMPRANGSPQAETVGADQLKRKLAPPGVVVLLACQTAVPSTYMFVTRLMENGASTLISTTALLPGTVAGQFATTFLGVLGEAGPSGISAGDAFWTTLKRLPRESQYAVPRFVLAGDADVRLCAPPLVR